MIAIELSHGVVERGGFEPPKAKPTDLQSAPFDRFGTSPAETSWAAPSRPTVLKEKIKSDESPPSRSLVPRDREGKPWAVRFRRTRPRESRCARWWLLFGPGVRPGCEVIARPLWPSLAFGTLRGTCQVPVRCLAESELAMGLEPATC